MALVAAHVAYPACPRCGRHVRSTREIGRQVAGLEELMDRARLLAAGQQGAELALYRTMSAVVVAEAQCLAAELAGEHLICFAPCLGEWLSAFRMRLDVLERTARTLNLGASASKRDERPFELFRQGRTVTDAGEESARRLVAEIEAGRNRSELRRTTWPRDSGAQMAALGRLFPTLCDAHGIDPWDPQALIEWLNGPAPGHGAACAGRFLLGVWNSGTDWTELGLEPPGRFDVFEAMSCWDQEHVGAMLKWLEVPFFP